MVFGNSLAPFRVVMIPETGGLDVIILPIVVYSIVVHKLVDVTAQPAYGCRIGEIEQIRLGAFAGIDEPFLWQLPAPA